MSERLPLQCRLNALWDEAERRLCAGQPPQRHIGGAYPPPACDSDQGARPWMTDSEATEAHSLALRIAALQRAHDAGAIDRLRAKHAARRARQCLSA